MLLLISWDEIGKPAYTDATQWSSPKDWGLIRQTLAFCVVKAVKLSSVCTSELLFKPQQHGKHSPSVIHPLTTCMPPALSRQRHAWDFVPAAAVLQTMGCSPVQAFIASSPLKLSRCSSFSVQPGKGFPPRGLMLFTLLRLIGSRFNMYLNCNYKCFGSGKSRRTLQPLKLSSGTKRPL